MDREWTVDLVPARFASGEALRLEQLGKRNPERSGESLQRLQRGVSGAHLNPAVSLALAALRGFPWAKLPAYVAAQVAGAFSGAALTYLTYREAFDHFDSGVRAVSGATATAGIFATLSS